MCNINYETHNSDGHKLLPCGALRHPVGAKVGTDDWDLLETIACSVIRQGIYEVNPSDMNS